MRRVCTNATYNPVIPGYLPNAFFSSFSLSLSLSLLCRLSQWLLSHLKDKKIKLDGELMDAFADGFSLPASSGGDNLNAMVRNKFLNFIGFMEW